MSLLNQQEVMMAWDKSVAPKLRITRNLEDWRELVVVSRSVLLWKRKVYPFITFALVSSLFGGIAFADLSTLTIISLALLMFTLTELLAPRVFGLLKGKWTAAKQMEFEMACETLAKATHSAMDYNETLRKFKITWPRTYYSTSLVVWGVVALIGNSVSTLIIIYVLTLALLMIPALIHKGII